MRKTTICYDFKIKRPFTFAELMSHVLRGFQMAQPVPRCATHRTFRLPVALCVFISVCLTLLLTQLILLLVFHSTRVLCFKQERRKYSSLH